MKSNTNTIDRLIWINQQKQMNSSFSASIRQASTSSQDIHDFSVQLPLANKHADCKLLNASVCKMALSKNLCYLTVLCSGDLSLQVLQDPGNCSNLRTLVYLEMDNLKVRGIPHSMMAPLAVGASRGVACVFATRKRALVYILDEVEI